METLEVRLNRAFREIRKGGAFAKRNVNGCCRSCIWADLSVPDGQPAVWSFAGQGNRVSVVGDYADAPSIYLYHSDLVAGDELTNAGHDILIAFARNGIEIDWDRTNSKAIEVLLEKSVKREVNA